MDFFQGYFIHWAVSNSIAILLLIAAIKKPKLARLLFVIIFASAFLINITTALKTPEVYLDYGMLTPFDFVRDFINGWFKEHISLMVALIALGQALIAIGMILRGWLMQTAAIGAIIFLLAIAPLGLGSGFPFSLITVLALYFILKKDNCDYLWKIKMNRKFFY